MVCFCSWAYRQSGRTRNVPWDSVQYLHGSNECLWCVERGCRESVLTVAPQEEEATGLGSELIRFGLSLQGHLNWPPFCLVMLNMTHLTHQVTIDRFSRKVSASKASSS